MEDRTPTLFRTRKQWHDWLEKNHEIADRIWLAYYKKGTGKKSLTYHEALEEAICYGWIDGLVNRIDEERYKQRWTPRRKDSIWSLINRETAERMIDEGRMRPAGMAAVEAARENGNWDKAYSTKQDFEVPDDLLDALKKNKTAHRFFSILSRSAQYIYCGWVSEAKYEETRKRRIEKVVDRCEKGLKPGE